MKGISIAKGRFSYFHALFILIAAAVLQCAEPQPGSEEHIQRITSVVDDNYLVGVDNNPGNWVSYGRNYSEDRFSSLDQINKENIGRLGLAWSLSLGTTRGIEATPLVLDGVMFLTGPW